MKSRFKELRLQLGLTQEEFRQKFNKAYHRNYSSPSISLFENNKRVPEISALLDFADFFAVSLDYLLCREAPLSKQQSRHNFTASEYIHLQKYHCLSEDGKAIVDATLNAIYQQEHPEELHVEKRAIS